jgi:hypothetical protein
VHYGHIGQLAGVCGEKLRGKIVAALEHDVVLADQIGGVLWEQTVCVLPDLEAGRAVPQGARGRFDLRLSDVSIVEEYLAMKVGAFDQVVVAKAEHSDTGTCQRHRCRAPKATDPHDKGPRARDGHDAVSEK